jgi:L-rhamnose mutarotase
MSRRFCLALDLKDDPHLIRGYEEHHRAVWPEILQSIRDNGNWKWTSTASPTACS